MPQTVQRSRFAREALIVVAFCVFTAILTWPYVTSLRDAVVDPGDPYLVSWILWWDYHQTFTDPLNLFQSNLFYPLRYTLAFSENSYGIALPFFPLYALGARPLTVHAVAIFVGFVLCGYTAFRLGRTVTGSTGAGWITGIAFAFVPLRLSMLSHVHYLFSIWIPVVFESLILFVRQPNRKRALYLGVAFFMSGLTCITWLTFSLLPLLLCAAVLMTRYERWRDGACWRRGVVAIGAAGVLLLPFLLPYYFVDQLYHFHRSIEEVKDGSALPICWLQADWRNHLWHNLYQNLPGQARFRLFPGLLPLTLAVAACVLAVRPVSARLPVTPPRFRLLPLLDVLIGAAFLFALAVIAAAQSEKLHPARLSISPEHALGLLVLLAAARLCFSYPRAARFQNANFVATLHSERRCDAFWIGLILFVLGFVYSLGWNFFVYRLLYEFVPIFRSIRVPARGAMYAYLGLALLAGLGAKSLAGLVRAGHARLKPALIFGLIAIPLLYELNAAPLKFIHGDIDPDAVTLRLKETKMRGGIVILPAGPEVNHRHVLRAADHMKPLIVGISGFNSPYEDQIEAATRSGPLGPTLMKMFEEIPASYVVISNHLIAPERRADYQTFLARAVTAGRLRFINRFDGKDDLYAVVKTEPETTSKAAVPFNLEMKDWSTLLKEDPINLLGEYRPWAEAVYRLHVASFGSMPRYSEFMADVAAIGRGVDGSLLETQEWRLQENLKQFAAEWTERPLFKSRFADITDETFIDRVLANAGLTLSSAERNGLIEQLQRGELTRAEVLLRLSQNEDFIHAQQARAVLLLHYFGYLRRNPDDPPDGNLNGFNFWLKELESTDRLDRLPPAFRDSMEYRERRQK